ncbi:hypothetical protein ABZ543_13180 [Streptomyces roseifaciens]
MTDATTEDFDRYTERAHLLGAYIALFGGVWSYTDPENPLWPVLYIESPEGQLSWHIHPDDKTNVLDHFELPTVDGYPWDQHTTREKYARIAILNRKIPKITYATPVYGKP